MQDMDRMLVDRYEQVRRRWCGQGNAGGDRLGAAVLVHRGMHAWMQQQAQLEPAQFPEHERAAWADAPAERTVVLAGPRAEVAQLLASMVIASTREESR